MEEPMGVTCSICGEDVAGDEMLHTENGPVCERCRVERVVERKGQWDQIGEDIGSSRNTILLWSIAIGSLAIAGLLVVFPELLPEKVRTGCIIACGLIGIGAIRGMRHQIF